jgi:uncharacterized membrane protein
MRHGHSWSTWGIPALYAGAAVAAGLTLPRVESRLWPGLMAPMGVSQATAIYSAIASGMIALTGIVFSLVFVMVQFSAMAYSPRLVPAIARDPVVSHALGTFTATFLYAIAALAGVDRGGSGRVPVVSLCVVVIVLVASVAMFIALIQRISMLRVDRVLMLMGDRGRQAIVKMYPPVALPVHSTRADNLTLPRTQTLLHHGPPRAIQFFDVTTLVSVAVASGGVVEMVAAVGDTLVEPMPILNILGARQAIDEQALTDGIEMGEGRTLDQDPKYAIRLLVDIAIRALSPAVNDPTTAVQALDQIEDLLVRLSQRQLEIGAFRDGEGTLRLLVPYPAWDDLLQLALTEICACGASSVQVMRRMNVLISDLIAAVPDDRRPALREWEGRLKSTIARSFASDEERREASMADRQGLGAPRGGLSVDVAP